MQDEQGATKRLAGQNFDQGTHYSPGALLLCVALVGILPFLLADIADPASCARLQWEREWGPHPPAMLTPEDEPLAVPAVEEEERGEAAALELAEDVGDELEDDELELALPKGAFAEEDDGGIAAGAGGGQGVDVKKLLKGAKKEFSPRKGSTDALDRLNIKSLPDDLELLAPEDEDYR